MRRSETNYVPKRFRNRHARDESVGQVVNVVNLRWIGNPPAGCGRAASTSDQGSIMVNARLDTQGDIQDRQEAEMIRWHSGLKK